MAAKLSCCERSLGISSVPLCAGRGRGGEVGENKIILSNAKRDREGHVMERTQLESGEEFSNAMCTT